MVRTIYLCSLSHSLNASISCFKGLFVQRTNLPIGSTRRTSSSSCTQTIRSIPTIQARDTSGGCALRDFHRPQSTSSHTLHFLWKRANTQQTPSAPFTQANPLLWAMPIFISQAGGRCPMHGLPRAAMMVNPLPQQLAHPPTSADSYPWPTSLFPSGV